MPLRPIIDWAVPVFLGGSICGFIGCVGVGVLGVMVGLAIEAIILLPRGEQVSSVGAFFGWFVGAWVGLVLGVIVGIGWTRRPLR